MKPGDLVRLIPDEDDEPDRYDGLTGLILREDDFHNLLTNYEQNVKYFWVMVNGSPYWRMPEDRLEVIDEAG